MNSSDVLIKPLITEKSTLLRATSTYAFEVRRDANKIQIKQAVKDIFKADVTQCKIIVVKPKKKALKNRRGYGKTAFLKKAMVTIKSGQTISELET